MKKLFAFTIAAILCLSFTVAVFAALPFTDVKESDWYYGDVKTAYEDKLINGKSDTKFEPNLNITYVEAIKLAACMHQLYTDGKVTLTVGNPWYQPYVDYCVGNKIIPWNHGIDFNAPATREGYMEIFANALPEEAFGEANYVPDGSIPDVPDNEAIYKLYRAGIVGGVDAKRNCNPNANIKRSEVAAVLTRMMYKDKRVTFEMPGVEKPEETAPLAIKTQPKDVTVEEIGTKAVFTVEVEGGKAPYAYQWYVVDGDKIYIIEDVGEWIKGAQTDEFTFIPDEACKEDIICIIEDADGKFIETDIVTIICEDKTAEEDKEEDKEETLPLAIKLQPVSQSVKAKETAYFIVEAEGGKAPYTYQWQTLDGKEWKKLSTSAFYQGVDTEKLKAIYTRDCDVTLRCVVTDADGATVTSDEAMFIVRFEAPALSVRMQPENAEVTAGNSVDVYVAAMGGAGEYSYQWQYANGATWTTFNEGLYGATGIKEQKLILTPTEAGTITVRCIISDKDGTPVVTDAATITVKAASGGIKDKFEQPDVEELRNEDFALAIDGVYNVANRGIVLTGKVTAGKVNVGDTIYLNDANGKYVATTTVKAIEMFNKLLDECKMGDKPGINVDLDVDTYKVKDLSGYVLSATKGSSSLGTRPTTSRPTR